MKNIPELSCAIVEDLLPTYVERLTSEETNMAVEAHLASCPACAAKRTAMGAKETEAAGQNAEETAREVDYLKKVRRRNRRRVWLAVACTTLVLAAVILTKIFIIGGPGQANDVGVRLVEIVDGDTLSVNVDCLYAVNAFYGWEQDETEDGVVSFTAREARASFIHPNDLVDLRVPLEGLKEVWVCGRLVWQNGTTILESTLWIYDARTPYVGDATAVGNLVHEIGLWLSSMELPYNYTISLQTTSEPYGLTIHFDIVTAHVLGVEHRQADVCHRSLPAGADRQPGAGAVDLRRPGRHRSDPLCDTGGSGPGPAGLDRSLQSGCRRGLDCPGECQGLRRLTGSPAAAAGPDMSRLLCGHGRRWNHHFHSAILKQRQKCPASFEAGHFYFADKSGSLNSLAVVPLPLPDLRQVHAVILDILAVLHQLVVHPLDQIGPPVTQ